MIPGMHQLCDKRRFHTSRSTGRTERGNCQGLLLEEIDMFKHEVEHLDASVGSKRK